MYSFFPVFRKYFERHGLSASSGSYKWPGKAKTLQFKTKNSVQFDIITTLKKGKEKVNAVYGNKDRCSRCIKEIWKVKIVQINTDDSVRKARERYLIKRGKTLEPLVIDKKDEMLYIPSICLIYTFLTFQISLITASTAFVARWGFSESIPSKLEH